MNIIIIIDGLHQYVRDININAHSHDLNRSMNNELFVTVMK